MADPGQPQPNPFSYLDEFGDGGPPPPASRALRLPDNTDLQPPIPDAALLDATDPAIDRLIPSAHAESTFVQDHYARVTHPVLDAVHNKLSGTELDAWQACHNGLRRARECKWLEDEDIYHLTERLVTWLQDQPGARLGDRASQNWWIVPELYALRISDPGSIPLEATPPQLAHPDLFSQQDQEVHKERFNAAKFTAHFVNCSTNHWSVIIYQRSNGNSWYIDSMNPRITRERSPKARAALREWLKLSGHEVPEKTMHYCWASKQQTDGWSCGLHAIANIMAFIRFELPGWERIEGWRNLTSREMRKELLVSLHRLMGLKYDPPLTPPGTQNRRSRNRRSTTPILASPIQGIINRFHQTSDGRRAKQEAMAWATARTTVPATAPQTTPADDDGTPRELWSNSGQRLRIVSYIYPASQNTWVQDPSALGEQSGSASSDATDEAGDLGESDRSDVTDDDDADDSGEPDTSDVADDADDFDRADGTDGTDGGVDEEEGPGTPAPMPSSIQSSPPNSPPRPPTRSPSYPAAKTTFGVRRAPPGRALVEAIRRQAQQDGANRAARRPMRSPKRKAPDHQGDGGPGAKRRRSGSDQSIDASPWYHGVLAKSPPQRAVLRGVENQPRVGRANQSQSPKRKADAAAADDGSPAQNQSTPRKKQKSGDGASARAPGRSPPEMREIPKRAPSSPTPAPRQRPRHANAPTYAKLELEVTSEPAKAPPALAQQVRRLRRPIPRKSLAGYTVGVQRMTAPAPTSPLSPLPPPAGSSSSSPSKNLKQPQAQGSEQPQTTKVTKKMKATKKSPAPPRAPKTPTRAGRSPTPGPPDTPTPAPATKPAAQSRRQSYAFHKSPAAPSSTPREALSSLPTFTPTPPHPPAPAPTPTPPQPQPRRTPTPIPIPIPIPPSSSPLSSPPPSAAYAPSSSSSSSSSPSPLPSPPLPPAPVAAAAAPSTGLRRSARQAGRAPAPVAGPVAVEDEDAVAVAVAAPVPAPVAGVRRGKGRGGARGRGAATRGRGGRGGRVTKAATGKRPEKAAVGGKKGTAKAGVGGKKAETSGKKGTAKAAVNGKKGKTAVADPAPAVAAAAPAAPAASGRVTRARARAVAAAEKEGANRKARGKK